MRTGHPINQYFGYKSLGFFQNADDIQKSASQFGTVIPGDIKYADLNGDMVIDANDQMAIAGTDIPTHTLAPPSACITNNSISASSSREHSAPIPAWKDLRHTNSSATGK